MPWYDEAVFYHIYPLGLLGAPKQNDYGEPQHRLPALVPWLDHLQALGVTALYIGPLFQSVGHGYETTDYRCVDSRLGTNDDLRDLVAAAHERGIRVVFDGVFNHVGRDFFAYRDLVERREESPYRDWFVNVDFGGNNSFGDGISYETWGGYDLLVKLNQRNPAVRDYLLDTVRFWVSEFDVDGIRLDTADVLDFDFMHALRALANQIKPDFWLMGEVIHGEYSRWVNGDTLHAVTNYSLHKALYSGHNDHNYFEIAHTVKRNYDMGGDRVDGLRLYNFVDNHDVNRIWTKLADKRHFYPVHVLEYTLPGTPSIYYGSEFAIEGERTNYADDMLRPALALSDFDDSPWPAFFARLAQVRHETPALSYGEYRELALTNRQYAFARLLPQGSVIVTVNNDDNAATLQVDALGASAYEGALTGQVAKAQDGRVSLSTDACSGDIWRPVEAAGDDTTAAAAEAQAQAAAQAQAEADAQATAMAAADAQRQVDDQWAAQAQAFSQAQRAADDQRSAEKAQLQALEAARQAAEKAAAQEAAARAEQRAAEEDLLARVRDAVATQAEAEVSDEETASADEGETSGDAAASGQPETPQLTMDFFLGKEKPYEEMSVQELQLSVLAQLAMRGEVTPQMRKDVAENVYHDSLVNWAKSFD